MDFNKRIKMTKKWGNGFGGGLGMGSGRARSDIRTVVDSLGYFDGDAGAVSLYIKITNIKY